MSDELQPGYPKGAGKQEPNDLVQILLPESIARQIEAEYLKPRRIELAGPLLFSEDDLPSYTITPDGP